MDKATRSLSNLVSTLVLPPSDFMSPSLLAGGEGKLKRSGLGGASHADRNMRKIIQGQIAFLLVSLRFPEMVRWGQQIGPRQRRYPTPAPLFLS